MGQGPRAALRFAHGVEVPNGCRAFAIRGRCVGIGFDLIHEWTRMDTNNWGSGEMENMV